jgi:hypothetical protein
MAITPSGFKTRFPEFDAVAEARIQLFLDDAMVEVVESTWGDYYERGVYYLSAHLLCIANTTAGGITTGAIGTVIKKKVGEIELGYSDAYPIGSYYYGYFKNTAYGLEYLRLYDLVCPAEPAVLVV